MIKKNLWIIVLVIVFLVLGVAADVFFWQHVAQENQSHQSQWQAKVDALTAKINQQQNDLTTLRNNVSSLQTQFTQLSHSQQQNGVTQTLSEAAYLLDLANLYLQINHDSKGAVQAMQLAQQRIQMLASPDLSSLQQVVNTDLDKLNHLPKIDSTDILMKLQALEESIATLAAQPLSATKPSQSIASSPALSSLPWYKRSLRSLWDQLKSLFVITKTSSETPNQHPITRENINFALAQARWAVLQQKTQLYQQSLQQVQQDLSVLFPDSPERQAILNQLQTLVSVPITTEGVDISASIQAVQQALQTLPQISGTTAMPTNTLPPVSAPVTPSAPSLEKPGRVPATTGVEI